MCLIIVKVMSQSLKVFSFMFWEVRHVGRVWYDSIEYYGEIGCNHIVIFQWLLCIVCVILTTRDCSCALEDLVSAK